MKVILLKNVRGLGQMHEVKNVADGYAVNFLVPQKAAEPATDAKIKQFEDARLAHEAELRQVEEQLTHKLQMLKGKKVTISSKATEKGGLFKGITAKDIAKAARVEHSLEIPEANIHVPTPIKTTGLHTVTLTSKTTKVDLGVEVVAA